MEKIDVLLLAALLVCHYLGDFCLTFPAMIRAKADGRNPWPILLHAGIHAVLIGACLLVFGANWTVVLFLMAFELVTHFLIDMGKGWMTTRSAILSNNNHKPYWMIYGFVQLLHQIVIIIICVFN